MPENKYPFLKTGYTSFPLRDVGKKFKVVDTIDIMIKKTKIMDLKLPNKYIELHINYKEIENAVWKKIRGDKKLLKEADWLVISMISEFGDKIDVSLDMLKEV